MFAHSSVAAASADPLVLADASFVLQAWASGLRPDQRAFHQLRDLSVEFPFDARNRCVVQLGATSVCASVECEMVEPLPMQPKHGFLEFHVTSVATSSSSSLGAAKRVPSYRDPVCQTIVKLLEDTLKTGKAIDTESLTIVPGQRVWSLRVDVTILADNGNAANVAVWAAMGALLHFRRPELSVRGQEVVVHPPHERDPIPLSVHHTPLPLTFAVVPRSTGDEDGAASKTAAAAAILSSSVLPSFVADPTKSESAAAACAVTISLNAELQVCHLSKKGGVDISYQLVKKMTEICKLITPQIHRTITKAMEEHDVKRKEQMRSQFQWAQTRTGVASTMGTASATAAAVPAPVERPEKRDREGE